MIAAWSLSRRIPLLIDIAQEKLMSATLIGALFSWSTQHRGSDAARVCAENRQHGLPELSALGAGAIVPNER